MRYEEKRLIDDLISLLQRSKEEKERVSKAFEFACAYHAGQMRASGERFITHPVEVARICVSLHLDTTTLCAALLHDTVEDTSATLEEIRATFGDDIACIVDGVTKLSTLAFTSPGEAQAENYRKMIVAMAQDVRVILVKLADRLHNMRTLEALPHAKREKKARETLEIYAPLAHRLGVQTVRCELEDLAFRTLHPHEYRKIEALVAQGSEERERYLVEAKNVLASELEKAGVEASFQGRAKHLYAIHEKMLRRGHEFSEIQDLVALRVITTSVKDCYGALGVVHALWRPLPGRFKDYIAMPKFNMYQSLHTTIIRPELTGPDAHPLEIQIRTQEMHNLAEYGVAAHWSYKEKGSRHPAAESAKISWLREMINWEGELSDSRDFMEMLRTDLFEEEVYAFTPQGDLKALAAGATPLDFAYSVHTEVGHRCVGARVNGRMVPLSHKLESGDIVEILTTKKEKGPSRDWLRIVQTSSARNKIKQWLKRASRSEQEERGREALQILLRQHSLPAARIVRAPLMREIMHTLGYPKQEDFYVALGAHRLVPQDVVREIISRLKEGEAVIESPHVLRRKMRPIKSSSQYGIQVSGGENVIVRLAHCCRPVPGDKIVGYVSLGRGITIHRSDCPNMRQLARNPERLAEVFWDKETRSSFTCEVFVEAQDRPRLLEDLTRVFAEAGVRIIEVKASSAPVPLAQCRFVVEVSDKGVLDEALGHLRGVESVVNAVRIEPGRRRTKTS